jgi:hypothetical protein
MILHIHSDASYLSENEANSRAGGFFYMGNAAKHQKKLTNGAILIIRKVLKHVMSSAAEAEIGAVFINAKEGAVLRTTLEELGHNQPHTPMETDNTTATGYSNGKIKQNAQKPWICNFIGSKTELKKANLMHIGARDFKIWRIISQSTIRRRITKECETFTPTPTTDR